MPGQSYDPITKQITVIPDEMSDQTTIEAIHERLPYHAYTISALWSKETLEVSAQTMLDIARYVASNQARIEQEAQEDDARNERAMSADMRDMAQIKQEWHEYRHTDAQGLGDETPQG